MYELRRLLSSINKISSKDKLFWFDEPGLSDVLYITKIYAISQVKDFCLKDEAQHSTQRSGCYLPMNTSLQRVLNPPDVRQDSFMEKVGLP